MLLSKAKAKAKVAVRRRRAAAEAKELDFIDRVSSSVRVPKDGLQGASGRDAPTLEDIIKAVTPLLPEPTIVTREVTNEITQKINEGDMQGMVDAMIDAKIPEIAKEFRPKVEHIREEIDPKKLEGFVTKKDLDDALKRVQAAIEQSSGGGGMANGLDARIIALESSTGADEVPVDTLIDQSGTLTYIGKATPGSATSASLWQIKRVEDLGAGDTDIRFADGTASFIKIWDNRATFTY